MRLKESEHELYYEGEVGLEEGKECIWPMERSYLYDANDLGMIGRQILDQDATLIFGRRILQRCDRTPQTQHDFIWGGLQP